MDEKRDETYEQIPWEMLEKPANDRQWLILGVAAAVVAAAFGYTLMTNRSATPTPVEDVAVATVDQSAPPAAPPADAAIPVPTLPAPVEVAPATTAPSLVAEADLYAIPPQRLEAAAAAHAEFFVLEFLTVDGSDSGRSVLRALLPSDVPLPTVPEGSTVFVEWVGAVDVVELVPGRYNIDVLARYMVARGEHPYQRSEPAVLSVLVEVDDAGPKVVSAPGIRPGAPVAAPPAGIGQLPPEIAAEAVALHPEAEVVGGYQSSEGVWRVVLMLAGPDGIARPIAIELSP